MYVVCLLVCLGQYTLHMWAVFYFQQLSLKTCRWITMRGPHKNRSLGAHDHLNLALVTFHYHTLPYHYHTIFYFIFFIVVIVLSVYIINELVLLWLYPVRLKRTLTINTDCVSYHFTGKEEFRFCEEEQMQLRKVMYQFVTRQWTTEFLNLKCSY